VFAVLFAVLLAAWLGAEVTLDQNQREDEVWLRWFTDPAPSRVKQVQAFEEMHPGIRIQVDPGVGSDQTKLIIQCATGVGADILDIQNQEQMAGMVDAGILLDLTPWAEDMGFSPENTYPRLKDALMYQGRQYRYPCNVYARSVLYNKEIFDRLGIAHPRPGWTWDDFVRIGKQIRAGRNPAGEPYVAITNFNSLWVYQDLLASYGGHYYSDNGLRSALDSREAIEAMQAYYDMMHVEGVFLTPSERSAISTQGGWGGAAVNTGSVNWFSGGRAAMIMIGRWYLVLVPHFPEIKGKLGAVELPRLEGREPTCIVEARAAGINVKSEHRDEALLFLQYLASETYGKIIVEDNDSLPPNPGLARTGADLVGPTEPDPGFHQVFIDAVKHSQTTDISLFIDANQVVLWLMERIDKVENRVLTPQEAMVGLAREVNLQIRQNLERRPDLQEHYEQLTGEAYDDSWWRSNGNQ